MKIGETIWVFDTNHRVYRRGNGVGGGPIWREHWVPHKVVGETSRSWVLEFGAKVPKKDASPDLFAFSEEHIARQEYVHDNRYRLGNAVGRIRDYETLRKIAELIGFKP